MAEADVEEIRISGRNPVRAAVSLLKDYEGGEEVDTVTVRFESKDSESNSKAGRYATESRSPSSDKSEEGRRKRGDIRANTSHHVVAYVLADLGGEEEYVPGPVVEEAVKNQVSELFIDINPSSIYPALTNLWERKLADRERQEGIYHYKLTEFGKERIKELGKPGKND